MGRNIERMSMKKLLFLFFTVVFATQALAETCDTNPASCTPAKLCEKTTEIVDDKTYWLADDTNPHLKLAKQFGLDCDASEALSSCQRSVDECGVVELCEIATILIGSEISWNQEFSKHVELAKSFGLNCSIAQSSLDDDTSKPAILTTCDKSPAACISEALCKRAADTTTGKVEWRLKTAPNYVQEAKKRKLDCGISEVKTTANPNTKGLEPTVRKRCEANISECSDQVLCLTSTYRIKQKVKWKVGNYSKFAEEAQRRGLDCGVAKQATETVFLNLDDATPCDKTPAACISEALCEKATDISTGQVEWRVHVAPEYVAEAKKRKLDCKFNQVKPTETKIVSETEDKVETLETATSSEEVGTLFDKADFKKLRLSSRKQLQYGLRKLGYYKGSIDGLYGPMSQNAVRDYAQDKDLVDGYPDSVLAALISEPGVGKNFAKYFNQTAHFNTVQYQDYDIFPIHEIICRSVFQAPWVGLKDLDKIKQFLSQSNNKCRNLGYQDVRYWLGDMPEAGVRIDLDNDGIRDLLVFLYGFQQGAPLKMVGFKFGKEKTNDNQSPIVRLFRADEIFASGEYPTVQSARFISVSDFNSDGEQDILISDGGYDTKPFTTHHSKVLLSSPNGFIEQNIGPRRKRHGLASGDINGDGFIDVLFGRSQSWPSGKHDTLKLYMNDGDANFKIKSNRLPRELLTTTGRQPVFVEFLDIDSDGFIDLVSGQPCGKFSKIFWNDGRGYFKNKNATIIPLEYQKQASILSGACQKKGTGPYNTIDQVFLVKESKTNKRYFGTISSRSYRGRSLSLFRIAGRSLSPSLTSKEDPFIDVSKKDGDQFAYKMTYTESTTGHRIDIFDFSFNRISLKFDPISERYQKVDSLQSRKNVRMKFDYNMVVAN